MRKTTKKRHDRWHDSENGTQEKEEKDEADETHATEERDVEEGRGVRCAGNEDRSRRNVLLNLTARHTET